MNSSMSEVDNLINNELIQVVYRSRSNTDEAGEKSILEASRRNNPSRSVSGVLVFHAGWFLQVLEGPAHEIRNLLAVIQSDPRHVDFLVLRLTSLDVRYYDEWSMVGVTVDADRFATLITGPMYGRSEVAQLLREFIAGGRWRDADRHVTQAGSQAVEAPELLTLV